MNVKTIGLASDHAGFLLKKHLIERLKSLNYSVVDFGTDSEDSCDYPDFAHKLSESLVSGKIDVGFSICGSGNGINMVVNKYPEIRSALCWNVEIAQLAVQHNNANVCALPARYISLNVADAIVDAYLKSEFEGGRHQKRIDKIPIRKS